MRRPELDLCRGIACLAVVLIHTVMLFWDFDPASPVWAVWNFLSLAVRFGVPLFFMLSGALLLGRERLDFRRHLRRIGHLLLLFYVWSALCRGLDACCGRVWTDGTPLPLQILQGYYHLWFLPALSLCCCALPLLHGLLHRDRENLRRGALLLAGAALVSALSLLPGLPLWLRALLSPYAPKRFFYLGYLLLGALLAKHRLSVRALWLLGLAALAALLFFARLNRLAALEAGAAVELWYGYLTPPAALSACFVFALCRHLEPWAQRHAEALQTLSDCTLGVYLLHPLLIDLLRGSGFAFGAHSALWLFPLCTLCFTLLPLGLTLIMKRIPGLKRLVT